MLRITGCILSALFTCLFSWQALAGNFDFLPASTGPARELRDLMNSGNYRAALTAWNSSQAGSGFANTQNGIATFSYLLYQNGLPFSGLEHLVQDTQPGKLDSRLLGLWTTEMKASPFIQKGWIPTTRGWKKIVDNAPVELRLKSRADARRAFARAARLPKDQVNARARVWWQIATRAPLIGDVDDSLKALKLLKESGQSVIGQDLISSTYGRVLYQKGDLDAALNAFGEIPKTSSLWSESLEERAWAHLRRDEYDKALGQVTTLLSPALVALVGPETYYMANLMNLKTCDYVRLFKTSDLFKKRHSERLSEMQDLAKTGGNKDLNALFERFEQNGVNVEAAGPNLTGLPRTGLRDARFVRYMESRRQLLNESRQAADLAKAAGALGASPWLNSLSEATRAQADRYKQLAFLRVRQLAKIDVAEYRVIINKMHIIEAEVIERLNLDENLKGKRGNLAKVSDGGDDVLVFPYKSDEVWFDELDNYQARVKDCPTLKGASL